MASLAIEELSLQWKNFESSLTKSISEMRDDSNFFDVEIACFDNKSEIKNIPAHKVVLSACSPVFKKLLHVIDNGDSKNTLLFLKGISYHDICSILDFMYRGQTNVPHNRLDAFLAAATELKVRGLTQENQSNGGNPIDLLTLRNCDSEDKQPDSFKNNDGLKSKAKESITAENVNHDAEYDDYQDYTEVEMDDSFNESTSQSHNEGEPDNVSIISNNSKVSQDYTQVEMNDPNYEKTSVS